MLEDWFGYDKFIIEYARPVVEGGQVVVKKTRGQWVNREGRGLPFAVIIRLLQASNDSGYFIAKIFGCKDGEKEFLMKVTL